MVAGAWGEGEMGSDCLTDTGFYFRAMKMSWNQIEVVAAGHRECPKCHGIVRLEMVNFVCDCHLNKNR